MQYLWKHKKTGHLYRIMGFVLIEKGLVPAVIYARHGELTQFIRPCDEFFDGRFRQVDMIEEEDPIMEVEDIFEEEDGKLDLQFMDGRTQEVTIPGVDSEATARLKAERFGGFVNPESIAAKAERHFAAKKGGEAL